MKAPDVLLDDVIAPPWTLTGSAYLLLYRFVPDFIRDSGFLPDGATFVGGIGSVMLINYTSSNVGPYQEALFIPGRVDLHDERGHIVTRIYVSSYDSAISGQHNWGLPKQVAKFEISQLSTGGERISARLADDLFLDITLAASAIRLPINSRFLPVWPSLVQARFGSLFRTRPSGSASLSTARILAAHIDRRHFPDVSGIKSFGVFKAHHFKITFPAAQMTSLRA